MVQCPECGEENREQALYCRKCGTKLKTSMYVKRNEPWGIVNIGVILLSVLLLITSFGLIMGGTSMRSIQSIMTDEEGYIMGTTQTVQVPSYAIVTEELDFDLDQDAWRFFQRRGGFLSFKMTTESLNPEKEIFIGVAPYSEAFSYIDAMEYHELIELNMGWEHMDMGDTETRFMLHPGDAPSQPPMELDFWVIESYSEGEQTITWEPESGRYYLVMMNTDGTEGIDASVKLGVKAPFLSGIGDILLGVGIVIGAVGLIMLYFSIKRN